jgi:hypothetical protein
MRHSEQRGVLHIELETKECNLPFDELTRLQQPLDSVAEKVGNLPSDLKVSVVHHPLSDRFHVSADLRLPRRSIFTGDWDPYLDTAAQRCLRKLIRKIEAYHHEPDREGDHIAKQVKESRQQVVAPQDPDTGTLGEAAREQDYARFRQLLAGHDDWLRLRIGRWLQRYPAINAQVGERIAIGDLVEEVFLNAFEGYGKRTKHQPLSDWLDELIDPSLRALWQNGEEEAENISFVRSLREAPQR